MMFIYTQKKLLTLCLVLCWICVVSIQVTSTTFAVKTTSRSDDMNQPALLKNDKPSPNLDWWKYASLYHVYVKSFRDSNNDGIGDLQGVIEKLDHFTESGIDAIFLSPVFCSPKIDQGYDISDFMDVDPDYGTMEDLRELIKEVHARGVKILLDFVPNHTSDQHQWFIDSVNGVEEYRDFYVWVDPKYDQHGNRTPPNNWLSVFHTPAWTWNEKRQKYYLHQFDYRQPDLNFRNPKVMEAMENILLFWLEEGVDGFRVDAIPYIFERTLDLPNEPPSYIPGYQDWEFESLEHIYTKDQPEAYELMYDWRKLLDNYTKEKNCDARILMTEAYTTIENTMLYFGTTDGSKMGAHFTFNFMLVGDANETSNAHDVVNSINKWLHAIPDIYSYVSSWCLSNHDNHRIATRCGQKNVDGFNMLKAILPGIDVTYYGEEIGQEDGEIKFEENQDLKARNYEMFLKLCRDFERTPFHWDDSTNAGFNNGTKPWLPVSKNYLEKNLKAQKETVGLSHYKVFQALTKFRSNPVLRYGSTKAEAKSDQTILIKRSYKGNSIVMVFNKGHYEIDLNVGQDIPWNNSIQIKSINSSRELGSSINSQNLRMDAHEALVLYCYN